MSKVEFVPFLLTETTDIFSIRINGDRMTELEKFLIMFKDRVVALPIYVVSRNKKAEGTLRLYGIRISNSLLIIGGGGLKTTQAYEQDEVLREHVERLQKIDGVLSGLSSEGLAIQDAIYNLTVEID